MKILILDDNEFRHKAFKKKFNLPQDKLTHTYTTEECIKVLTDTTIKDKFDLIYLDHDLGGEEMVLSDQGTGYEVAEFIAYDMDQAKLPTIGIVVHSLNPIGRKNMLVILHNSNCKVIDGPFAWKN